MREARAAPALDRVRGKLGAAPAQGPDRMRVAGAGLLGTGDRSPGPCPSRRLGRERPSVSPERSPLQPRRGPPLPAAHGRLGPCRHPRAVPDPPVESLPAQAGLPGPPPRSLLGPAPPSGPPGPDPPGPPGPLEPSLRGPGSPHHLPERSQPDPGDPQLGIQGETLAPGPDRSWPAAPMAGSTADPACLRPLHPAHPRPLRPSGPVPACPPGRAHPRPQPPGHPCGSRLRDAARRDPLCPRPQVPGRPWPHDPGRSMDPYLAGPAPPGSAVPHPLVPGHPWAARPWQPRPPILRADQSAVPGRARHRRRGRAEPLAPWGPGGPDRASRQRARQDAGRTARQPVQHEEAAGWGSHRHWTPCPPGDPTRADRAVLDDLVGGARGRGWGRSFGPRMLPRVAPRAGVVPSLSGRERFREGCPQPELAPYRQQPWRVRLEASRSQSRQLHKESPWPSRPTPSPRTSPS
jgi:hypothetical protein